MKDDKHKAFQMKHSFWSLLNFVGILPVGNSDKKCFRILTTGLEPLLVITLIPYIGGRVTANQNNMRIFMAALSRVSH